jgi:hypothetical protein
MTTMAQGDAPGKWSTVTTSNFGNTTAGSRSSKAIQIAGFIKPTDPPNQDMPVKQEASPDSRSRNAGAVDALQEARQLPPGAQRADALKQAGLLQRVADSHGLILAKQGRSRSRRIQEPE